MFALRRHARALVLLPVTGVLLSCGGGSTHATTVPGPTTTSAPASPAPKGVPDEIALRAALLPVQSMPVGYSPNPAGTGSADSTFCNAPANAKPAAKAEVFYQKSDLGPFLDETLRAYDGTAGAELAGAEHDASSCTHFTQKDGTKVRVAALSFPKLGDETFALQLEITETAKAGGQSLTADIAFVRIGPQILAEFGALGGPNPGELVRIARAGVARIRSHLAN
jgi:hypothetical protein